MHRVGKETYYRVVGKETYYRVVGKETYYRVVGKVMMESICLRMGCTQSQLSLL